MEGMAFWFTLSLGVLILALRFRVRAAATTQNHVDLKRRVSQAAYWSYGIGGVCVLLFVIILLGSGLLVWSWMTAAGLFIVPIATSLLIQVKTGELDGGGSIESGKKVGTIANRLIYTAVAMIIAGLVTFVILQWLAIL